MALIESVFKRDAYDRTMSFQTIAEETRLPLDEVEHLIMKALRCVSSFMGEFCYLFLWWIGVDVRRRDAAGPLMACDCASAKAKSRCVDVAGMKSTFTIQRPALGVRFECDDDMMSTGGSCSGQSTS